MQKPESTIKIFDPSFAKADLWRAFEKHLLSNAKTDQRLQRKIKRILKEQWEKLVSWVPKDMNFEDYARLCVMSSNQSKYAEEDISNWALICRHAVREKFVQAEKIKDLTKQLRVEDKLIEGLDRILSNNRRIGRKFMIGMARDLFPYRPSSKEALACARAFLSYEPRGRKLNVRQIASGLNSLFDLRSEWFAKKRAGNPLIRFLSKNEIHPIPMAEWSRLKASCRKAFLENPDLNDFLDEDLRMFIRLENRRGKESLRSKALEDISIWKKAWMGLQDNQLLKRNDCGEIVRSVFQNEKFRLIENSFIESVLSKVRENSTSLPRESHLRRISPYVSESFLCRIRLMAHSKSGATRFIELPDQEAVSLAESIPPNFWKKYVLLDFEPGTGRNSRHADKVVSKLAELGCENLVTPEAPRQAGKYSNGRPRYVLDRIHEPTFRLWAEKIEAGELVRIVLGSNPSNETLASVENRRLLIRALAEAAPDDREILTLLSRVFGQESLKKAMKDLPEEFEDLSRLVFGRTTPPRGGRHKQKLAKFLFDHFPKVAWSLLESNPNGSTLMVCLRFLEIDAKTCMRILSLEKPDGRNAIESVLSKGLPTRGLARLLDKAPKSKVLELFPLKPKSLFPVLCRKAGEAKATQLVLENKQFRTLLNEKHIRRKVSQNLERIRSSLQRKPSLLIALDAALLISMKDIDFLRFMSWKKSVGWKEGKRSGFFDDLYETWTIPKKNGDDRTVCAPHYNLKRLQRRILDRVLSKEKIHHKAHGFAPGKGIVSNARVHVKQKVVVNLDVADFFPSTSRGQVFSTLCKTKGVAPALAGFIADLCCYRGSLPIGAPTSPCLANLILRPFDKAMSKAASALGAKYTRYADDLTISGDDRALKLIPFAERLLGQRGYSLNRRKINVFRPGRRQVVTGLTVNKRVSVPRAIRRKIRAALHARKTGRRPTWKGRPATDRQLAGLCSFVRSVNRKEGNRLINSLARTPEPDPCLSAEQLP